MGRSAIRAIFGPIWRRRRHTPWPSLRVIQRLGNHVEDYQSRDMSITHPSTIWDLIATEKQHQHPLQVSLTITWLPSITPLVKNEGIEGYILFWFSNSFLWTRILVQFRLIPPPPFLKLPWNPRHEFTVYMEYTRLLSFCFSDGGSVIESMDDLLLVFKDSLPSWFPPVSLHCRSWFKYLIFKVHDFALKHTYCFLNSFNRATGTLLTT